MNNIWLQANADLSTVLFANVGDMTFLKNLPQCSKLQIMVIFVRTDVAVFLAFELPSLHLLGLVAIERWTFVFFATCSAENPEWPNKLIQFKIFSQELASMNFPLHFYLNQN
jgi:hypothetical protein